MNLTNSKSTYDFNQNILIAVDCIIFGFDGRKLKLLLFKRKIDPLAGRWSLIGTFVNDDLTVGQAAKKLLFDGIGLQDVYLEQLKCYSNINRDPGDRVISVAHFSLIRINDLTEEVTEEHDAHWFDIDELPDLILDHYRMVQDALIRLKKRVRHQPLGVDLLPKYFTIPQLQALYESVCGKSLDSRNFRKKIFSFDMLIKTDKKDKSTSKKGAYLYKFNKSRFEKLVAQEWNFEI